MNAWRGQAIPFPTMGDTLNLDVALTQEERMNFADSYLSFAVFLAIGVLVSSLWFAGSHGRSPPSIVLFSAALSSLLYAIFYSFSYGVPAFLLFLLVATFLYYLPLAFLVLIACLWMQRR